MSEEWRWTWQYLLLVFLLGFIVILESKLRRKSLNWFFTNKLKSACLIVFYTYDSCFIDPFCLNVDLSSKLQSIL